MKFFKSAETLPIPYVIQSFFLSISTQHCDVYEVWRASAILSLFYNVLVFCIPELYESLFFHTKSGSGNIQCDAPVFHTKAASQSFSCKPVFFHTKTGSGNNPSDASAFHTKAASKSCPCAPAQNFRKMWNRYIISASTQQVAGNRISMGLRGSMGLWLGLRALQLLQGIQELLKNCG